MQLDGRARAPLDHPGQRVEPDLDRSVQRQRVKLIEREIHESGEIAFDQEAAADQLAHERADRAVLTERHERAEIAVLERRQRLAGEMPADLAIEMRGLLMCRLG